MDEPRMEWCCNCEDIIAAQEMCNECGYCWTCCTCRIPPEAQGEASGAAAASPQYITGVARGELVLDIRGAEPKAQRESEARSDE